MFDIPLAAVGIRTIAPAPVPGAALASSALAAVSASATESVLVGGISFGAHLAAEWALGNPSRCAGLVLALPAWHGAPGSAPASLSARLSAAQVRSLGVAGALAASELPPWLAGELGRAWRGYGDGLAVSLELAAERAAPTLAELETLDFPVGIAACSDDPVHPADEARAWAAALPRAAVCSTRLAVLGRDPEALGRAGVLAWLRAGGRPGGVG